MGGWSEGQDRDGALGRYVHRTPSSRSIRNVSMQVTSNALQTSGIFTRLLESGLETSCVTTVPHLDRAKATSQPSAAS